MLEGFEKVTVAKKKDPFITVTDKTVRINKPAASVIGERVSLYENKNKLALSSEADGQFRVATHKGNQTKYILSKELSEFILNKYSCSPGTRLKAFIDKGVLVFEGTSIDK